ncbi:hypothetical protein PHLGIDRAFT_417273 [Phlebiopsis gigantea 11061_1 CR5-6]|uniref:Uncharacterized protein n=1 Tax=Phlebiopsis gigantea (strain 11061_1 CR5-6) TaxID=745531 RepID=A0A0C3PVF8_PHLG1|nr:hypothetical protein PHLGIDRAFT_417273 [Phlebiopsis gigantea 11061_1 CR5-6]
MDPIWKSRFSELESECIAIEATILDLHKQLHEKRIQMNSLPPIQSLLSDDIMYAIFEAAYLHDFPRCRMHSGLIADSIVVPTHVCRRWRRLALDLPALWSCLHITSEQSERYPLALLAFLERSKNRKLSITFICHTIKYDYSMEDLPVGNVHDPRTDWPRFMSCLGRLLEHRKRWQNLGIYIGDERQLRALYKALHQRQFPSLQFLQILADHAADLLEYVYPLQMQVPNLRELRGNTLNLIGPSFYSNLTDLMLDNYPISASEFITTLAKFSSTLERLVLRLLAVRGPAPLLTTSLLFPRLRYLAIADPILDDPDNFGEQAINNLLRSCPNIEVLQCTQIRAFEWIVASLPQKLTFDHAHSVFLHSDDIYGMPSNATDRVPRWYDCLDMFPVVREMYIHDPDSLSSGLAAIRDATVDEHIIWPELRSLAISLDRLSQLPEIINFLQHRAGIQRPLQSVTLMCNTAKRPEFITSWEAETGLPEVFWKPYPSTDPFDPWDDGCDRPSFKPWKGSLSFEDQDLD